MVAKNTVDFQKALRAAQEAAEKVMRATMFTLYSTTSRDTPVDTGRLRANWQVTLNQPATHQVGGSTASNPSPTLNSYTIDKTMYLTNNLPYADVIENGGANRTANFMLKRALAGIKSSLVRQSAIHRIR